MRATASPGVVRSYADTMSPRSESAIADFSVAERAASAGRAHATIAAAPRRASVTRAVRRGDEAMVYWRDGMGCSTAPNKTRSIPESRVASSIARACPSSGTVSVIAEGHDTSASGISGPRALAHAVHCAHAYISVVSRVQSRVLNRVVHMRTDVKVATLSLAVVLGACNARQEQATGLSEDLQKDLAVASAASDLAPKSYQRARFVSEVEMASRTKLPAPKLVATKRRTKPVRRPVPVNRPPANDVVEDPAVAANEELAPAATATPAA